MKKFKCTHCHSVVFFENIFCVNCGDALGFIPDNLTVAAFTVQSDGLWQLHNQQEETTDKRWKPCANYASQGICNWMLPADDPETLCCSCRYTEIIPALNNPENKELWFQLETAKRRLFYTLYALKLPIPSRLEQPEKGLTFHFKEDSAEEGQILTGHDSGLITLNIAEADDVEREARKKAMREPYRTLLGHFRHESGHFYWDQLIDGSAWLEPFRQMFGDESMDYAAALEHHYQEGPPANWENAFVSAYASMHPWEDWAETWAHYLHIVDALDTADQWQLALLSESVTPHVSTPAEQDFGKTLLSRWAPVAQFLNSMNRSLGHKDIYPFLLSDILIQKLAFIDTIVRSSMRTGN